jgi:hypothetical protein
MERIEELLRTVGEEYVHATHAGERVQGEEEAYFCDAVPRATHWVECGSMFLQGHIGQRCPGDPGYGRPSEDFVAASAIGQVIAVLAAAPRPGGARGACLDALEWKSRSAPRVWADESRIWRQGAYWVVMTGGVDDWDPNCGYREGVDPASVAHGRFACGGEDNAWARLATLIPRDIVEIAAAAYAHALRLRSGAGGADIWRLYDLPQNAPYAEIGKLLSAIEDARAALNWAPVVTRGARRVREQLSMPLLLAARRDGVCFIADEPPGQSGRAKVVCQNGTPEQISAFMAWAPSQGLGDVYGDPERGIAGGYTAVGCAS